MSGLSTTPPWSGEGPAITARCGSHNTIRAPIPMSLSTKKSRDSNSFSNTSRIPSHWDATTIAIDIRSAGKAGPRAVLQLRDVPPQVGADPALLTGVHDQLGAVESRTHAQPLEAQEDAPQIVGPHAVDRDRTVGHGGGPAERGQSHV